MTEPVSWSPHPPVHEHVFHPGAAAAGRAAREADPPRPYVVGCAVCGRSVQLGSPQVLARRSWPGPVEP